MKRATADVSRSPIKLGYFNPRPREEGDVPAPHSAEMSGNFNPRPREEGDVKNVYTNDVYVNFNPRPREEGDG